MTDGRITHLTCTATVIADDERSAALAEGMLRTELPAALPAALDRVLGDDQAVYVARSLRFEVHGGPSATGEVLARSIAAQLARAVRDPDRDDTNLVRFASADDYLATFLAAMARGDAWRRWYFGPLRRLSRLDTPAAFLALAAEGHDMAGVLLVLRRSGELGPVVAAVGENALAQAWPPSRRTRPQRTEWLSLVRLALDLARVLGWETIAGADPERIAARLAERADRDLDWSDPVGLAHALAAAVHLVSVSGADARDISAAQLPGWLDWADPDALVRDLSAPMPPPLTPASVPPPRTTAIEAALSRLASRASPDLERQPSATAFVLLWTALAEEMPELAGADWARDVVRRFVNGRPAAAPRPAPAGGITSRRPAVEVPCAGLYLLLRTLDAMKMPGLCRRAGVPAVPLLQALAHRWAGPVDVTAALRPVTGETASWPGSLAGGTLQLLQSEVTRIAMAQQRQADQPLQLRAVPFGTAAMAAIPGDADDLGRAILLADLAAMAHAHSGDAEADLPLDLIALTVLRHWSRWLRGFSGASVPYLLGTFVRRPGLLTDAGESTLRVTLSRLPHDVVLEVSGCLDSFELYWPWDAGGAMITRHVPGRPARRVEFAMEA